MKRIFISAAMLLSGCAGTWEHTPVAERMYVIDCGENHVKDLSRWTPGINVGKPHVFSDHCYLIRHARGWMLWDTGNPDRYAAMPNGFSAGPTAPITAYMKKPLMDSLKEIGVAPAQIQHFAMSHSHGDHDVFGDGSVVVKSSPGHTPGHQSLFVRLPKSGSLLLSGDMLHLVYSWDNRVVPSFNYNVEQSGRSIDAMKTFVAQTGAQIWITHDKEQHASIPKSPAWID